MMKELQGPKKILHKMERDQHFVTFAGRQVRSRD